ncbi:MAG: hypothetical protein JWL77_3297 [Chthonomonadaceae bacterium]|nr:hypothetical protein [Chthonomonadaceae bacterium]
MERQDKILPTDPLTIPVHVGTMGWSYADWNGPFYPVAGPGKQAITLYARACDVVEIDSTFYGTPRETTVRQWVDATPPHFLFCPKVPRLITHDAGLRNVGAPLEDFVATMALLREKRGPMLIQMPPSFTRHQLPELRNFLPLLIQLSDKTARFAIEFRDRSLVGTDVADLLAEHGVALVAADYPAMPKRLELTTDFVYMRLIGKHGAFDHHRELQADRSDAIARWTGALRANQSHLQAAYIFCNNDYEGYGPGTVNKVRQNLGLSPIEKPPETQGSLF